VATGSLLDVDLKSKTIPTLRMYPTQTFRCFASRLTSARAFHTATALPDGEVLIVGGVVASPSQPPTQHIDDVHQLYLTSSIEVYDPRTGLFRPLAEESKTLAPRAFHSAILLNDTPPYQVLLVGGVTIGDPNQPALGVNTIFPGSRLTPRNTSVNGSPPFDTQAAGAEIISYQPGAVKVTRMTPPPDFAPAAFLAATKTGNFVVVAGGVKITKGDYDNANTVEVTTTAGLANGSAPIESSPTRTVRLGATLSPFGDRKALLWGGALLSNVSVGELISQLDGTPTSTNVPVGGLNTLFHTATVLSDGTNGQPPRILITGGFVLDNGGTPTINGSATEPSAIGSPRIVTVDDKGALQIQDVMLAPSYGAACGTANRYKPAGWESAAMLPGGKVLITGGTPASPNLSYPNACPDCEDGSDLLCAVRQASLYDTATLTPVDHLQMGRFGHSSTTLHDGTVLIVGGMSSSPSRVMADAEIYNPHLAMPSNPDDDDPLKDELKAQQLLRQPGHQAYKNDPTIAAIRCSDL
jgi:hypothetical protein